MKTALGEVKLKTGEMLQVSCILGPEESEAGRLAPFLGHKGGVWRWHIEKALREPLDVLETRFYVGEIGGRLTGNVCTFENRGVGIFGHVYTHPDHRQKGIASGIIGIVMDDFRKRGGQFLALGTEYNSPAYRIYEGFGFKAIAPGSGTMTYSAERDYAERVERELSEHLQDRGQQIEKRATGLEAGLRQLSQLAEQFGLDVSRHDEGFQEESRRMREAAGVARVRRVQWGDWPHVNSLFLRPGDAMLRNLIYQCFGPTQFEGDFLQLMQNREDGKLHGAWVYVTGENHVVGFASAFRALFWPGKVWMLDLYLHPLFEGRAADFLAAVDWPQGKAVCHVESERGALNDALPAAGLRHEGTLERHFRWGDLRRDVEIWSRETPDG